MPRGPSAGVGEFGVVGGWGSDRVDLGAVGAVGVPAAGGISVDAEAVVDLGVVAFAEQPGVGQAGLPAVHPFDDVVDLAPPAGGVAAGEHAGLVAQLDGSADGRGDQAN